MKFRVSLLMAVSAVGGMLPFPATAGEVPDFSGLSIEELMRVEITSASRQEERWLDVAAAVTVITPEEMRRAGALTIPDALRLVPGMDVAQIDANKWAVSARGFLGRFSNKLLVLVDGRSVYTPFFGGVEWDMVDFPLESIERIEVIRGPGGSLWGSNAVNGVVNVITRSAGSAEGVDVVGTAGASGGLVELRIDRNLSAQMALRGSLAYRSRSASPHADEHPFSDEAEAVRADLRWDWQVDDRTDLVLQGRFGDNTAGTSQLRFGSAGAATTITDANYDASSAVLHAHASRRLGDRGELVLASYFVDESRDYGVTDYSAQTWDLDVESSWSLASHELVAGVGHRLIEDRATSTPWMDFSGHRLDHEITSAFAQDRFPLFHPRLTATAGFKVESNSYSDYATEWQPNARLLFSPHDAHRLWAATSRAVRTPSLIDGEGRFLVYSTITPEGPPLEVWATGSGAFHSEEVVSWEAGYRTQPRPNLGLDLAWFHNEYRDLRGSVSGSPTFKTEPMRMEVELTLGNHVEMASEGWELEAKWHPASRLRLVAGGSRIRTTNRQVETSGAGANVVIQSEYHAIPKKLHARASFDLTRAWELDTAVYHVDRIATMGIPEYTRVDVRIGWRPGPGFAWSLGAQNLFESRHVEFGSWNWELAREVERNVYTQVAWRL